MVHISGVTTKCVCSDDVTSCPCQLPLPEEIHWTPGDSKLHDMSAEEVANQLVVFDWELFSCVHEVGEDRPGPYFDPVAAQNH